MAFGSTFMISPPQRTAWPLPAEVASRGVMLANWPCSGVGTVAQESELQSDLEEVSR